MIVLVVIVPVTTIVHLLLRLNRRNIKLIVMCLSMIVMMKTSILWQFLLSFLLWFTFKLPRPWQNLTPVQITLRDGNCSNKSRELHLLSRKRENSRKIRNP